MMAGEHWGTHVMYLKRGVLEGRLVSFDMKSG